MSSRKKKKKKHLKWPDKLLSSRSQSRWRKLSVRWHSSLCVCSWCKWNFRLLFLLFLFCTKMTCNCSRLCKRYTYMSVVHTVKRYECAFQTHNYTHIACTIHRPSRQLWQCDVLYNITCDAIKMYLATNSERLSLAPSLAFIAQKKETTTKIEILYFVLSTSTTTTTNCWHMSLYDYWKLTLLRNMIDFNLIFE